MKVVRALIIGNSASFISYLPPLSTIYTLLSAAYGGWLTLKDIPVGFVFLGEQRSTELPFYSFDQEDDHVTTEQSDLTSRGLTMVEIDEPQLWLYTPSTWILPYLKKPRYPLYWGKFGQRAYIVEIREIDLTPSKQAIYTNTLLPFPYDQISARVEWLPASLSPNVPRKPLDIRPFYLVMSKIKLDIESMFDMQKGWSIFIHGSCK